MATTPSFNNVQNQPVFFTKIMNGNTHYLGMYLYLNLNDASVAQSTSIYLLLIETVLFLNSAIPIIPGRSHFSFFPVGKAAQFFSEFIWQFWGEK